MQALKRVAAKIRGQAAESTPVTIAFDRRGGICVMKTACKLGKSQQSSRHLQHGQVRAQDIGDETF